MVQNITNVILIIKNCGATKLADTLPINEAAYVAEGPSRERENRRSCG